MVLRIYSMHSHNTIIWIRPRAFGECDNYCPGHNIYKNIFTNDGPISYKGKTVTAGYYNFMQLQLFFGIKCI